MDFKTHFEQSWTLFVAHLPALLISTLVLFAVSVISLGIMAPVLVAGYMQSLLLLVRDNRKPEVGDLFKQMRLFSLACVYASCGFAGHCRSCHAGVAGHRGDHRLEFFLHVYAAVDDRSGIGAR